MKKTDYLISLGETWVKKYASVDANSLKPQIGAHIQSAIENAAQSNIGITNFPVMLNADQATLNFVVVRNDTLGFRKINVLNFEVSPPELTAKYQPLSKQIETYLNKHWELFPTLHNGEGIDYSNFAINLTYKPTNTDLIAGD